MNNLGLCTVFGWAAYWCSASVLNPGTPLAWFQWSWISFMTWASFNYILKCITIFLKMNNEDYSFSMINITNPIAAFSINDNIIYCKPEIEIQISCFFSQGLGPRVFLTQLLSDISLKIFSVAPTSLASLFLFFTFPFHVVSLSLFSAGSIIIFLTHIYKSLSLYLVYLKWLLFVEKCRFWIWQERGC